MTTGQNHGGYLVSPGNLIPPPQFILVPEQIRESNTRYAHMKHVAAIRTFASFNIIFGVASIGIQITALCINGGGFDVIGHGIWAGAFYVVSGGLGLGAASKKTKGLIISGIVIASISIAAAIVASVLSGVSASFYCYYYNCDTWYSIEWSLMAISICAFCSNIVLTVLLSVALCSGRPRVKQHQLNGQPANAFVAAAPFPQQQAWQSNMEIVNGGYQTSGMLVLPAGAQIAMPVVQQHSFSPSNIIVQPVVAQRAEQTAVPVNVSGKSVPASAPLFESTAISSMTVMEIPKTEATKDATFVKSEDEHTKETTFANESAELYPKSIIEIVQQ